jgi:hypothetical protein
MLLEEVFTSVRCSLAALAFVLMTSSSMIHWAEAGLSKT